VGKEKAVQKDLSTSVTLLVFPDRVREEWEAPLPTPMVASKDWPFTKAHMLQGEAISAETVQPLPVVASSSSPSWCAPRVGLVQVR
jgi:hypothetical protein